MPDFPRILRRPLRWLAGAALAAAAAHAAFLAMPAAGAAGADERSGLPVLGALPPLDGAVTWLNSPALGAGQLQGKVVLVDFWTYSCINCIRTVPYLRAWAQKYREQGLVVVGVHTPEFEFEKDIANVNKAVARFGIDYPVAVDSERRIWNAFRNDAWPVFYVADARGRLRARLVGEGNYDRTERIIQALLAEAGGRGAAGALAAPRAAGEQAAPDAAHLRSGETYLGYAQASNLAAGQRLERDAAHDYGTRTEVGLNEWSLAGDWTVGAERAHVNSPGGGIAYRFSARDLHLVLGPGNNGKPVRFQVRIDGRAPGRDRGSDIDADGKGIVTETRLYQLVRQSGAVKEHLFEIRFLDAGADAFAFTFG
jgi:thiol-disulfide isomerase/thioredoxin